MSGVLSQVPVSPSSIRESLRDAEPTPFWLDDPDAPEPRPQLIEHLRCDLLVVGGGFSGLWTALLAKEEDPSLDVVLVEGERIGWAATGRNGGFVSSSLTHGLPNGVDRFADELPALLRLGDQNLDAIEETIARYGIDAQWERNGELTAAYEQWQVDELGHYVEQGKEYGVDIELWDADRIRSEVHSPTYLGGLHEPDGTALVNPGRLAWGLAAAAESLGVRIFERTKVTELDDDGGQMVAVAGYGRVTAPKVALATNIFPNLVKRARSYVIPVWDYVLMTEPLSSEQLASVGWDRRQGIGDGWQPVPLLPAERRQPNPVGRLRRHLPLRQRAERGSRPAPGVVRDAGRPLLHHVPSARGAPVQPHLGRSHRHVAPVSVRSGARPTAARSSYVLGYTGLGVGATRFGAQVMLDHLHGRRTERTELAMVRKKPIPFPPEPIKSAGIQLTRWSISRADQQEGKRNLWLRSLDRLGLGFDS